MGHRLRYISLYITPRIPLSHIVANSPAESDLESESSFIADETLYERIAALKDIVPASTRRSLSSKYEAITSWTKSGLLFGGKTLWVVSTSALLLGVPWALAYSEEQMIVEQERAEMMNQRAQNEVCVLLCSEVAWSACGGTQGRRLGGIGWIGLADKCDSSWLPVPTTRSPLCKRLRLLRVVGCAELGSCARLLARSSWQNLHVCFLSGRRGRDQGIRYAVHIWISAQPARDGQESAFALSPSVQYFSTHNVLRHNALCLSSALCAHSHGPIADESGVNSNVQSIQYMRYTNDPCHMLYIYKRRRPSPALRCTLRPQTCQVRWNLPALRG